MLKAMIKKEFYTSPDLKMMALKNAGTLCNGSNPDFNSDGTEGYNETGEIGYDD